MKRKTIIVGCAVFSTVLVALVAGVKRAQLSELKPSVELGRHLVTIIGCNDCHTPFIMGPQGPEPDMTRMLSGHPQSLIMPPAPQLTDGGWVWAGAVTNTAFVGPWGVSYTANLTPHETTGLGIWTEQMFVDAIRDGKHMGQSRAIQPPMPWPFYRHMTDHELRSIFAYLRTIPQIDNLVPDYREPGSNEDVWDAAFHDTSS